MSTTSDMAGLRERLSAGIVRSKLAAQHDWLMEAAEGYVELETVPTLGQEQFTPREERDRRRMASLGLGASRLGGVPDLPPGSAWPTLDGKKLPFLAQIDLAALPRWPDDPLPAGGWLCAFGLMDEDHRPSPTAVIHCQGDRQALVRAPRPADGDIWRDWQGVAQYETVPISSRLAVTIPDWKLAGAHAPSGREPIDFLIDVQCAVGAVFPRSRQPEMIAAGYLLGQVSAEDGSAASLAEEERMPGGDWRNLLTLRSVGSMSWSDCGVLYLLIRHQGLITRNFSNLIAAIGSAG